MSTPRHAHWLVRLPAAAGLGDDVLVDTDDLTLDEGELAEKASGTPWTLLNPAARASDAKALFLVVAMRCGLPEPAAVDALRKLTLRDAQGCFTYVPADADAELDGDPLPPK